MTGEAYLRGRRPAQEAHMRPRRCHGKKKGAAAGSPRAAAPPCKRKSAAHERNALSSHGLPPQYFRRGGA